MTWRAVWKVTHVDAHHRRRQVLLACSSNAAATALAEALYGAALYMAAVRLRARAGVTA